MIVNEQKITRKKQQQNVEGIKKAWIYHSLGYSSLAMILVVAVVVLQLVLAYQSFSSLGLSRNSLPFVDYN